MDDVLSCSLECHCLFCMRCLNGQFQPFGLIIIRLTYIYNPHAAAVSAKHSNNYDCFLFCNNV